MRPTLDAQPAPPAQLAQPQLLAPPAIHLLGVRVHLLTVTELINYITRAAMTRQRAIVAYANAHGLNLAYEQAALRCFFNDKASLVFCDGFGVSWGARLAGLPAPQRYTPPDWIGLLCAACAQQNLSLYLLGGQAGIAERAAGAWQRQHANLAIAGVHHGHFDQRPGSSETQAVLRHIEAARPHIVLVGFGMPAQEYWLGENWDRLPHVQVALTVGALFDYASGNTWRAPRWMTDHGLEWLGRLITEPGRLWRRYLIGNPLFLMRVLRQRLGRLPHHR